LRSGSRLDLGPPSRCCRPAAPIVSPVERSRRRPCRTRVARDARSAARASPVLVERRARSAVPDLLRVEIDRVPDRKVVERGRPQTSRSVVRRKLGDLGPVSVQRRVEALAGHQLGVRPCSITRPCSRTTIGRRRESSRAGARSRRPSGRRAACAARSRCGARADVDRRRRLVEDQDPRIGEQGSRKATSCLWPSESAFRAPGGSSVAVLERHDELFAPTACAAAATSAGLASGEPKAMLSRTVPANRNLRGTTRAVCAATLGHVAKDAVDRDAPSTGS
jgi:hypothetical protein